jgi:hypothetical protein
MPQVRRSPDPPTLRLQPNLLHNLRVQLFQSVLHSDRRAKHTTPPLDLPWLRPPHRWFLLFPFLRQRPRRLLMLFRLHPLPRFRHLVRRRQRILLLPRRLPARRRVIRSVPFCTEEMCRFTGQVK